VSPTRTWRHGRCRTGSPENTDPNPNGRNGCALPDGRFANHLLTRGLKTGSAARGARLSNAEGGRPPTTGLSPSFPRGREWAITTPSKGCRESAPSRARAKHGRSGPLTLTGRLAVVARLLLFEGIAPKRTPSEMGKAGGHWGGVSRLPRVRPVGRYGAERIRGRSDPPRRIPDRMPRSPSLNYRAGVIGGGDWTRTSRKRRPSPHPVTLPTARLAMRLPIRPRLTAW
jgi:hypothetical protein